jgi:hypothetical protein
MDVGAVVSYNKGNNFFLHIVMKVALFYTQNRCESNTFLHEKS